METITRKEFEAYEKVRVSGVTNMLMVGNVSELSGLSREVIMTIIKNYFELVKKYPKGKK